MLPANVVDVAATPHKLASPILANRQGLRIEFSGLVGQAWIVGIPVGITAIKTALIRFSQRSSFGEPHR